VKTNRPAHCNFPASGYVLKGKRAPRAAFDALGVEERRAREVLLAARRECEAAQTKLRFAEDEYAAAVLRVLHTPEERERVEEAIEEEITASGRARR
jgi:hypothetical protein